MKNQFSTLFQTIFPTAPPSANMINNLYWKLNKIIRDLLPDSLLERMSSPESFIETVNRNNFIRSALILPLFPFILGIFSENLLISFFCYVLATVGFLYYYRHADIIFGKNGGYKYLVYFLGACTLIYYMLVIRTYYPNRIIDQILNKSFHN